MANQKAILQLQGARTGRRGVRITLVDTDATASTFTDTGAATSLVVDDDFTIVGIQGQGATAPATATAFQLRVNGMDKPIFINGAAVFDATSSQADRLGVGLGAKLRQGSTLAIIGRA